MRARTPILIVVATLLGAAMAAFAAAAPEVADGRVHGKVVAVTATEVYVDFGADAGVQPGDSLYLAIGREELALEIIDVAPNHARAALPPDVLPPGIGALVSAVARPSGEAAAPTVKSAEPPEPADIVTARWREVDRGRPRRIGFRGRSGADGGGAAAAPPGVRGTVAVDYLGIYDLRAPAGPYYHRVQVRSNLDLAPPTLGWLDYSHRLRLRLDFEPGGPLRFAGSRDALLVHRLRAGLSGGGVRAEVGRTDAAPIPGASLVDGATVRYRVAPRIYLGGFGGASPQLLDLAPSIDGYRFGAYASFRDALARGPTRWRLSADLGFVGTTFDGALDRRAFGARAAATSGRGWLSAQSLVDLYGADHPAQRPAVDLSTATIDAGARWGRRLRVSAGFDHFRAERTREALAVLPADYLASAGFSGARSNLSVELARGLDLDLRAGYRWPVAGVDTLWFGGGLRRSALVLRDDHLWLGGDGYFGGYQDGGSGFLGYGFPLHPRLDLDASYRIAGYRYGDENQRLWRHWVKLGVDAWLRSGLTLQVEADAQFGDEGRALTTFASAGFRF